MNSADLALWLAVLGGIGALWVISGIGPRRLK